MIFFSKYKDIDNMYAFKILEEIANPDSKYTPFACYGAIGAILLLNNWIVVPGEDEYINKKLESITKKECQKHYGLYIDLKRTKFKEVFPSLLEAIYNDDFILFFSLLCLSGQQKEQEEGIKNILDKGLSWKLK